MFSQKHLVPRFLKFHKFSKTKFKHNFTKNRFHSNGIYFSLKPSNQRDSFLWKYLFAAFFVQFVVGFNVTQNESSEKSTEKALHEAIAFVPNEKVFRIEDVAKHNKKEHGIWVYFKGGVYDITRFIPNHPGGQEKIVLASGSNLEPFWNIYRQHYNTAYPLEVLKSLRIGRLHPDDIAKLEEEASHVDSSDPFSTDPQLAPMMIFHQKKPINAEPPEELLTHEWITPNNLWFVRNHHPVPNLSNDQIRDYQVKIQLDLKPTSSTSPNTSIDSHSQKSFSLEDLKSKFKPHSIVSTIQCGGNRRTEMSQLERTNGSPWNSAAISTAEWTGVRLRDLLASMGVTEDALEDPDNEVSQIKHIHFVGLDEMEASVPIRKALCRYGDAILAYKMNGEDIPREHGFPLRAIVPGHVGVRNVKWVSQIRLSHEEAHGAWQRGMSYKGFNPSVRSLQGIDVSKIPSLQEQSIQSAITFPRADTPIHANDTLTVKGYSYSGGGRGVIRVDVSIDGGRTWKNADLLEGSDQPLDRSWAWTFWECDFDLDSEMAGKPINLVSRAVDASHNVQPDSVEAIWNIRGINNNAWSRVDSKVQTAPKEES